MTDQHKSKNICLNYHAFSGSEKFDQVPSKYTVNFDMFIRHLDFLQVKRQIKLPELLMNSISDFNYCLTFDDGYNSHLHIAEELVKRKLTGVFYIITDKVINNSKYMNINDLRELDLLGMTIGSHTCSHRHINRLSMKEMIKEIHDSKCFLEDILSKPIDSISYPGGHFGSREVNQAIKEGYVTQRTCINGLNYLPVDNHIIKCYNIKNFVDVNYLEQLTGSNSYLRILIKMRELGLKIPKDIHSKLEYMRNYKQQ